MNRAAHSRSLDLSKNDLAWPDGNLQLSNVQYVVSEIYEASMIKGLHHNAYRCKDSEETRKFYENFLGLPLAGTLEINETQSGRKTNTLHTFYGMDDGSYLAFFEAPDMPFDFKEQHDFDLHIALEVTPGDLELMLARGKAAGFDTRGVTDHRIMDSIYFRDPNGYVIELTAKRENHDAAMDPSVNGARDKLDAWQRAKTPA